METIDAIFYHTCSPVLFLVFNRPDAAQRVFDQIKVAKPPRLYIGADGPRDNRPGEDRLCQQTRAIFAGVDWECEVKTLFRETNGGCKEAVSAAVTWFFENEEEGIVLEDDCLPANSFFKFCDVLLEKYRFDDRIRHITGCNLQQGKKWGDATYYFSNVTNVWGWAGWRRVWKEYDKELTRYSVDGGLTYIQDLFTDSIVTEFWLRFYTEQKAGKINSWAYPLTFINFFNNGLCVVPNINLVSNLGFGEGATHTWNDKSLNGNVPLQELTAEIKHPNFIIAEKRADLFALSYEYDVAEIRRKRNLLRRRFKRWLRVVFTGKKLFAK
jgi:hypothetical protein